MVAELPEFQVNARDLSGRTLLMTACMHHAVVNTNVLLLKSLCRRHFAVVLLWTGRGAGAVHPTQH